MSGQKTQTTTQSNEPMKAAQAPLNTAMNDAMSLYNKGRLVGSSNINTAVPISSSTQSGMNTLARNANYAIANDAMPGVMKDFKSTYGAGGYNDAMRSGMQPMEAIARGDFLNRTDQNFEDILSRTKENAGTDVGQMMSGMGRFAGGAHQGILADTLGGIESDARLGQYNLERDRQTDAANSLFGMGQTGMSNVGQAGDIWSSLLGARNQPANDLMGVGSIIEDYRGRQINDQIRKADAPLTSLQTLLGIAQGAGQYGTSRAQTPQPNNTMSNVAGMGLSLASLLGGGF